MNRLIAIISALVLIIAGITILVLNRTGVFTFEHWMLLWSNVYKTFETIPSQWRNGIGLGLIALAVIFVGWLTTRKITNWIRRARPTTPTSHEPSLVQRMWARIRRVRPAPANPRAHHPRPSLFHSIRTWLSSPATPWERKPRRQYWVPDIMFNPITWTVFQAVFTLTLSCLVILVPYLGFNLLVANNLLRYNPIALGTFFAMVGVVFVLLNLPEMDSNGKIKVFMVPAPKFGALLTWFGMVLPMYLTTGKYWWTGRRLGFDWLKAKSETIANEEGFIRLGDITFQIWNSPNATTKEDRSKITIPAKNRAPITGSLTFILERFKPRLWLDAQDAGLDIGERARQEYQEIVELLNDTDVAAMQDVMSDWMRGRQLITSFITKDVPGHKAGSVLRDDQGVVMVTWVGLNETVEDAKARFVIDLASRADPKMLKEISKKVTEPDGTKSTIISVSALKASSPVTEVVEERGFKLSRVTYGDVTLSQKVLDAAAQASAETDEHSAQVRSAKANREARKLLMPTPTELANPELYQLTTILAAAGDDKKGNVRVVMVPGGGRMTSSLVAAASQIGAAT